MRRRGSLSAPAAGIEAENIGRSGVAGGVARLAAGAAPDDAAAPGSASSALARISRSRKSGVKIGSASAGDAATGAEGGVGAGPAAAADVAGGIGAGVAAGTGAKAGGPLVSHSRN